MYKFVILFFIFSIVFFSYDYAQAQEPKLETFREFAEVIIDQKLSNNVTSAITLLSTDNQEIRVPSVLVEEIQNQPKIYSVIITNEESCILGVQQEGCVIINTSIDEIEGGIFTIQDTAKEMGDSFIDQINAWLDIDAKFHSVYIHTTDETSVELGTSGVVSGRGIVSATYTMPKEDTESMYQKFSSILLPVALRDSGGFYEVAKNLSKENNAAMTISIIPQETQSLFQLKLSVDYPNRALEIDEISPLEFLGVEKLTRSKYFIDDFYPLNSLLKVVVLSSEPLRVDQVRTNIVPTVLSNGERFPDFTNDGWFFNQESGNKIEATYLFGKEFSVDDHELIFTVVPLGDQEALEDGTIEIIEQKEIDFIQILVLIGIIMAAVGAAVYYLKGFRKKS